MQFSQYLLEMRCVLVEGDVKVDIWEKMFPAIVEVHGEQQQEKPFGHVCGLSLDLHSIHYAEYGLYSPPSAVL